MLSKENRRALGVLKNKDAALEQCNNCKCEGRTGPAHNHITLSSIIQDSEA